MAVDAVPHNTTAHLSFSMLIQRPLLGIMNSLPVLAAAKRRSVQVLIVSLSHGDNCGVIYD